MGERRRTFERAVEVAVDAALGEVARQQGGIAQYLGIEARNKGILAGRAQYVPSCDLYSNRPAYLVVIIREGHPEVRGFKNEDDATGWADEAGAQWSETFVAEIIKGPFV